MTPRHLVSEVKARLRGASPSTFARLMYAYRGARALGEGLRSAAVGTPAKFLEPIAPPEPVRSRFPDIRLNLLIPTIEVGRSFGGVNTALEFWRALSARCPNVRLVTFDAPHVEATSLAEASGYTLVSPGEESRAPRQITYLGGPALRSRLGVGPSDLFIGTFWRTALAGQALVAWQAREFGVEPRPLTYLIQDFEPGFYPWSDEYVLADSTYTSENPTYAIFNSTTLQEYFNANRYRFAREYAFEPQLNRALAQRLESLRGSPKIRSVLIYGRPNSPRNAFGLIVDGLRLWQRRFPNARDWTISSAGEVHGDIALGKGVTIRNVGKLSLDGYTRLLAKSAVGVSLMVSPHPSYPPLEMAHFGVRVLSNSFANKNLGSWHENLTSLDVPSPERLAESLCALCSRYEADPTGGWTARSQMPHYLEAAEQFPFVDDLYRRLSDRVSIFA